MSQYACSIEGCDQPIQARGWCSKHYSRWYTHGDPEKLAESIVNPKPVTPCSIEGCAAPADSHGWCSTHYTRWLRHGDPLTVLRPRGRNGTPSNPVECSKEGCDRPAKSSGLCNRHYRQQRQSERGPCSVPGCEIAWFAKGLCGKHYTRMRSFGTTDDPETTPLRGSCSAEGCDGPVKARDLCGQHLRRWTTYGTTELPEKERLRLRTCRFCKRTLTADHFTISASACTDCLPLHRAELNAKILPRTKKNRERIAQLREEQANRCAICGVAEEEAPKGRLYADHDHETQQIRGLLCGQCNSGLGMFKDDPNVLIIAIEYLKAAQALGGDMAA